MWAERCPRLLKASAACLPGDARFVLQLGDLVQGDCDDQPTHKRMLDDAMQLMKRAYSGNLPFVVVEGNHDIRGDGAREAYHAWSNATMGRELNQTVASTTFSFRQGPDAWVVADGLDMPGLMAAFQTFWRENSGADRRAYEYGEATPHLVLMAFLQRVTNGEGRIGREMALGSKRLDLCVEYRGHRYAVEVKTAKNFAGEVSYGQLAGYLDSLGLPEGWMAIFDEDKSKPWEEKLYSRDVAFNGKTLHVVGL